MEEGKVEKEVKELRGHEFLVKNMLTTGKLIEWLKRFPEDTLVYRIEHNTGDWQEIPGPDGQIFHLFFSDYSEIKSEFERYYRHIKKDKFDEDEMKREFADEMKYVNNETGVFVRV